MLKNYEDNLVAEMFSPQLRSSISGITTERTIKKSNTIYFDTYIHHKLERMRDIGLYLIDDDCDARIYSDNISDITFSVKYDENNYINTNNTNSMVISVNNTKSSFYITANQFFGASGTILLKVINFNSLKEDTQHINGGFFIPSNYNSEVNSMFSSYHYNFTDLDTTKFATLYLTWNWNSTNKSFDLKAGTIGYKNSSLVYVSPSIPITNTNPNVTLKEKLLTNFDTGTRYENDYPWFYFSPCFEDFTTLKYTINSFRMYSVILDDAAIKEFNAGTPYINKSDKTFIAPNFSEKSSTKKICRDGTVNAPGGFEETSSGNVGVYKNGSIKAYSIFEK